MANVEAALPFWLDRRPEEAFEIAAAADAAGVHGLWVGEMTTFEAFALAGAIAATTQSFEVTVGPLPVLVRDPVTLAMGVATVAMAGRRPAHLALGTSSPTVIGDWHGIGRRASPAVMADHVALLRSLFAGERSDHAGPAVSSHGFRLRIPAPSSLSVAAFGPRSLEVATRVADRVVLAHVTPTTARVAVRRVHTVAAELERPAPEVVVWLSAAADEAGQRQLAENIAIYLRQPGYGSMFARAGFADMVALAERVHPRELAGRLPAELIAAVACVGAVALEARVAQLADVGVGTVVVLPATVNDPGGAAILAAAVDCDDSGRTVP